MKQFRQSSTSRQDEYTRTRHLVVGTFLSIRNFDCVRVIHRLHITVIGRSPFLILTNCWYKSLGHPRWTLTEVRLV